MYILTDDGSVDPFEGLQAVVKCKDLRRADEGEVPGIWRRLCVSTLLFRTKI